MCFETSEGPSLACFQRGGLGQNACIGSSGANLGSGLSDLHQLRWIEESGALGDLFGVTDSGSLRRRLPESKAFALNEISGAGAGSSLIASGALDHGGCASIAAGSSAICCGGSIGV